MKLTVDGQSYEVRVFGQRVEVDGTPHIVKTSRQGNRIVVEVGDRAYALEVARQQRGHWSVRWNDRSYQVVLEQDVPRAVAAPSASPSASLSAGPTAPGAVRAPVPGRIVAVKVKMGDTVEVSDLLVLLEAMKMENEIRSPVRGIVQQVFVSEGQRVREGEVLVLIG